MGKVVTSTVKIGVAPPIPNQISASTIQAIGGTPNNTVTTGRNNFEKVTDNPANNPNRLPKETANTNPLKARVAVTNIGESARPCSIICARAVKVSRGAGKIKLPYTLLPNSHRAKNRNSPGNAPQILDK